jgi:hypothetical protein
MADDALQSDGGYATREQWERENEAAMRKATASKKRFRRQRPQTKREKLESSSRAHSVISAVDRLKKIGLQGLKNRPDPQ